MCCPLDPNAFTGVIDGGPPCKTRMAFSAATTSACIAIERVKILNACCLGDDAGCPLNDKLDLQGTLSHSCSTFGLIVTTCQHHFRTISGSFLPASHIKPCYYSLLSITGDCARLWSLVPTLHVIFVSSIAESNKH